jgi:5-methylcytosine-specific restriction endonuclease McrA
MEASCKICEKKFSQATLTRNGGMCGRCVKKGESDCQKQDKIPIPAKLRQEVWEKRIGDRFWGNCFTCNMRLNAFEFACGHIISESTGGETVLENLQVVCKSCNSKMGTQNMLEFKKIRYSSQPEKQTLLKLF